TNLKGKRIYWVWFTTEEVISLASISGSVLYDGPRTANPAGLPGIPNVPVTLSGAGSSRSTITDGTGRYLFDGLPDGSYQVSETAFPPVPSAGTATGANALDATTPTTLFITLAGTDATDVNFLNGPVKVTPIQAILDENVTVLSGNLITEADGGTFGSFPKGTQANTGAPDEPYPGIGTEFSYTLPNPVGITPAFHQYTVQNLMNDATANIQQTWWRIADHTTGDETGRMMVINGDVPGSVFFEQRAAVRPNTYYLLSSWILNMSKNSALSDPQLGVVVLDENGQALYRARLGALIPMDPNQPEWKQIGTIIHSRNSSFLTVRFTSMGPEAFGNDYAIDDISLNEVKLNPFAPVKTASPTDAHPGDTVTYTVTLHNPGRNPLTDAEFMDIVPAEFGFVPGSVTVNGIPVPDADPNKGFSLPQIVGGGTGTVTFQAMVLEVPGRNPVENTAGMEYSYTPVTGGIPERFVTRSNIANVNVTWLPPCCWPFAPMKQRP
ncbi:MAG: DUF11 domain-containing protein, partial [Oscillospiraceae bacterium]|nr:DUF11 domain-containing protein [Oscillospiraceae bacterium]